MSLSKQLLLLLSFVFFIIFSASLILSINNIKSYLEVESQFHVKDTATSLGLSLSPHMENEQDPILETMITAIFNTGYYREIRLVNIENQQLVKLTNPKTVSGVPQWFIDLVPMQLATAVSEISSGWQMTGKLYVTTNPSYGYLKLYQQAKSTLVVSGLIFLAAIILLITVLRFTLKPLKDIAQQAEQISAGHFTSITKLPWTHEVKNVAISMNSMSAKIRQMISRLNQRLEIVSESLKQDPLTQLLNQSTFEVSLKQALSGNRGEGYAALIKFDDLGFLSKNKGNEAANNLLREFASILRSTEQFNTTAYRLQGSEFALLFPGFSHKEMLRLIQQLKYDINVLGKSYLQQDLTHIGVIRYERSSDFNKLYPGMVEAYEQAKNIGNNAYYIKEDLASAMSDVEWKTLIISAINNDGPIPEITFTAEALDYREVPSPRVMEEAFTKVRDNNGNVLSIGTFFSMAQEFQLVEALDQSIVNKVITLMEKTAKVSPVTINLTMDSISSHAFNLWLKDRLGKTKINLKLLSFSVTAYSATKDITAFSSFARFINASGATVLLKRYSPDIIDIEQLKSLNINYLRLARDLTTNIADNPNKVQFLDLIGEVATLLDIKVLAEGVTSESDLSIVKAKSIHGISR
ncbi:MAG: EAL domain-containing protein (putative c-di-GMP-specific phosphodiesterase class I) [Methylophagaceae bacterium]|jgi:EAL domain-containing protein (putative c-di-GMP-specific phosphodiesterase class I)/GGDEF domain-containing protein